MLTEFQKDYIRKNFKEGREKLAETLNCPYDDVADFFKYRLMRDKDAKQYFHYQINEMFEQGLSNKQIAENLELSLNVVANTLHRGEKTRNPQRKEKTIPGLDEKTSKIWEFIKNKSLENNLAVMDLKISSWKDIKLLDMLVVRNLIRKLETERDMCVRIEILGEI